MSGGAGIMIGRSTKEPFGQTDITGLVLIFRLDVDC
jgi:hypothetical protein